MRLFPFRRGPFRDVEKRLGYRFSDSALLETALTHRSHAHEQSRDRGVNYERLEFLGDALLGFEVSRWLYADDETAPEGVLSRRRQSVVRTATLAEAARRLELGATIRLGRGEERTGGRDKASLLADTFEAVIGAIYLDGGVKPAGAFIRRHLGANLEHTRSSREASDDYKTRLQESIQAKLRQTPRYRIVSTSGPAHALRFEVEVLIDGRVSGSGSGSSRKQAEQNAARNALRSLEFAPE
jgi:ribonuclease-3